MNVAMNLCGLSHLTPDPGLLFRAQTYGHNDGLSFGRPKLGVQQRIILRDYPQEIIPSLIGFKSEKHIAPAGLDCASTVLHNARNVTMNPTV